MRDPQDADVLTAGPSSGWRRRVGLVAGVVALVVALDQATKAWALDRLTAGSCSQPDACIDLIAGARFRLVFNTGAAFTRGAGYGPVLAVLAMVLGGVLLVMAVKRPDRLGAVLFAATAGGAVGNLLDRIFRADDGPLSGAVIDFIDLGWWPVFNIADSAIVVGVISIIALSVLRPEEVPGDEPSGGDDAESDPELRSDAGADVEPELPSDADAEPGDPDDDLDQSSPAGAIRTDGAD